MCTTCYRTKYVAIGEFGVVYYAIRTTLSYIHFTLKRSSKSWTIQQCLLIKSLFLRPQIPNNGDRNKYKSRSRTAFLQQAVKVLSVPLVGFYEAL
jgi:hypothetical protein